MGSESPQLALLAGPAGQLLWLAGSLAVAAATFPTGLSRGMGLSLRHWPWDTARAVLAYLLILPVCHGLLQLMAFLLPDALVRPHTLFVYMGQVGPAWQVLAVFSAVLLAPVAEEVFFRGLLQSMVRQYTGRPWVAVVLTSLFFAAVHAPLWHTLPALFALSIVLGYNYERCGRLVPSVLIHVFFNGVAMVEWFLRR
jgi:membrane protease YdiL (CAAX protease family)